ncbi:hypothetical protein L1987_14699 [Smallanthus sonchifolius]|uniref:Uncharacterized protein n=1 Tax=Smallanthus sonchifolius TaxID=185202 RepID=A0ACB9J3Y1_9ASTR|nr:hypothetical protein L1987_14699 [Smallanthus sonchifolius]
MREREIGKDTERTVTHHRRPTIAVAGGLKGFQRKETSTGYGRGFSVHRVIFGTRNVMLAEMFVEII